MTLSLFSKQGNYKENLRYAVDKYARLPQLLEAARQAQWRQLIPGLLGFGLLILVLSKLITFDTPQWLYRYEL